MMRIVLIIPLLVVSFFASGQGIMKSIYIPNPTGDFLFGASLIQNNDGTYTAFTKNYKFKIIHLDSACNILWAKSVNPMNVRLDNNMSVDTISDSTFIVASTGYDTPYKFKIIFTKMSRTGQVSWVKSFGRKTHNEELYGLKHTNDGGFIIVGDKSDSLVTGITATHTKAYVVKTDTGGNIQWSKGYDRPGVIDMAFDVAEAKSGFLIVGATYSSTSDSARGFLVKTDKSGNTLWRKGYSTPVSVPKSIIKDGNFFVLACSSNYDVSSTAPCDAVLLKVDSLGNPIWSKQFHFSYNAEATKVIKTLDGGYLIFGYTRHFPYTYGNSCFLIKTDSSGNMQWCKKYGGRTQGCWGNSLQQASNGDFCLAAEYYTDKDVMLILRTDSLGNGAGVCQAPDNPTVYSPTIIGSDIAFPEEFYNDTAFIEPFTILQDSLVAVDSCTVGDLSIDEQLSQPVNLFPNPSNGIINLDVPLNNYDVEIKNALGTTVITQKGGIGKITINMAEYPKGFYTCLIRSHEKVVKAIGFILM